MNKKAMAIAVAGALAVPAVALAQTSTVQIGGSITTLYYSHDPNNPSSASRGDILETSEPEVYISGEEKLGGGLSVWFRCASSMDGITGGSGSANGLCARNSAIGFKGSWGNLFQGNWDTPHKNVYSVARGWWSGSNPLAGGSAIIGLGGAASGAANPSQTITTSAGTSTVGALQTAISNTPQSFFRRQANSWNYHSPTWNGFNFQASFSAHNESTGQNDIGTGLSQRLWSLGGNYRNGPLYLGLAYEQHQDYNPGNQTIGTLASQYSGGDDHNWMLVGAYRFGAFELRGFYSQSEYDTTNAGGLDVDSWGIFADWNIQGPHTLRAQYARADDTSGTTSVAVGSYKGPLSAGCGPASATSCATSTGAKAWGLAYSYAFSKRTMGSVVYTKLDNDSGATFSKGKAAATAGNNQSSLGIMLQHRF